MSDLPTVILLSWAAGQALFQAGLWYCEVSGKKLPGTNSVKSSTRRPSWVWLSWIMGNTVFLIGLWFHHWILLALAVAAWAAAQTWVIIQVVSRRKKRVSEAGMSAKQAKMRAQFNNSKYWVVVPLAGITAVASSIMYYKAVWDHALGIAVTTLAISFIAIRVFRAWTRVT